MRQWTRPSLVQIMACSLSSSSHFLHQCWLKVNWTIRNRIHWNTNQNSIIFIYENAFENVVWKMATILSRRQCVKQRVRSRSPIGLFRYSVIDGFAFFQWFYMYILVVPVLNINTDFSFIRCQTLMRPKFILVEHTPRNVKTEVNMESIKKSYGTIGQELAVKLFARVITKQTNVSLHTITLASQITSLTTVYSPVNLGVDQRKQQSAASLAFVLEIHRWSVNSLHKGPVTRKMFPYDDVIMLWKRSQVEQHFISGQNIW